MQQRKQRLIEELILSEERYLKTLTLIDQGIRIPVSAIIGEEEGSRLFRLDGLIQLNTELLA
jgi:hypothetical protein